LIDSARHFRQRLEDFYRLQRRLLLATVLVSLVTVPIVALTMNLSVAGSVLVGSCAGLLYVRLLARSVARLSDQSRGLGRFQLIVPTLLVVGSAKLPQLDLLPAFLGFLLYKPAPDSSARLRRPLSLSTFLCTHGFVALTTPVR